MDEVALVRVRMCVCVRVRVCRHVRSDVKHHFCVIEIVINEPKRLTQKERTFDNLLPGRYDVAALSTLLSRFGYVILIAD